MTNEDMLGMLQRMLRVRHFEEAWGRAYLDDEIGGVPPAVSVGQEAVSVGACAALEDGDFVFTTHRGQAPHIARGMDPGRIMADLYCRAGGYIKGKSYHVTDMASGVVGMGGIVAGQVPVAGGMALAQRMQKRGRLSLVFFGDGAANEGAVHETCNLAAIWRLPLILLCENNGYCISLPADKGAAVANLADRAAGYGLPGVVVDGNDPLAVFEAVRRPAARARAGEGATFIEAKTTRLTGHLIHDPQRYRPPEDIEAAWANCPIKRFRERLTAQGLLDNATYERLEAESQAAIRAALDYARQCPPLQAGAAFDDLWA